MILKFKHSCLKQQQLVNYKSPVTVMFSASSQFLILSTYYLQSEVHMGACQNANISNIELSHKKEPVLKATLEIQFRNTTKEQGRKKNDLLFINHKQKYQSFSCKMEKDSYGRWHHWPGPNSQGKGLALNYVHQRVPRPWPGLFVRQKKLL